MKKFLHMMVAVMAIAVPSAAQATPISLNQWYTFSFGDVGSALGDGSGVTLGVNPPAIAAPAAPWDFITLAPVQLVVSDGFNSGDQFELFDNLSSLGLTSTPTGGGDCSSDITACLADITISKGAFILGAGSHSLTGTVAASFSAGAGFFQVTDVVTAVPEPVTFSIFGAGLLGAAAMRRRKAKKA